MRIGMILDKPFPTDSRVENEAVSLLKGGHEVFLFCLGYANEPFEEKINGIHIVRYVSNTLEYKLSALAYTFPFYTFLMAKKIKDFLSRTKVEAIHVHDIRIAEASFQANKKYKLPVILDLHDNMPEIMKFYPHLQKFPGKYLISPKKWKRKEEVFIKKADKVITVSPEFVNEIKERTKIAAEKLILVPNTVREAFYKEAVTHQEIIDRYKEHFVLLYVGDTNLRRGLQTPIRAIKKLKEQIPNLKLVIVGVNTTDVILREEVKDLGIEDYVDFEGWQDISLFPSYIMASDVCLSPLFRNVQHDVAYANKLFQYMSFAKPLLVSNAIAQKNLTETHKVGKVHLEKNEEDFADKVLELYHNEAERKEMGNRGKEFIEKQFSWKHTSKELLTLYDDLKV